MTFIRVFCLILTIFIISPDMAEAGRAKGIWRWLHTDYGEKDAVRPYLEDGHKPHAYLWNQDDWDPAGWLVTGGDPEQIIKGLYKSRIIREQSSENGIPVLEVGNNFMTLSKREQSRILTFLDHAYGITEDNENAVIHLEHEGTNERIGLYTIHGLQMQ